MISDDLELLARLHAVELDQVTIENLAHAHFPYSLTLNGDERHPDKPIFPVVERGLQEISASQVSLDQLAADFAAIYLNVSYKASPNESAWIDEDHIERQEPMFEVRNWYLKYGLSIQDWRLRQDDNLSLQLLFISHLLRMEKIPFQDVAHFMDYHILRWIGKFADQIFNRADTAFYACLACLTSDYLEELRDLIAEVESKPRLSKEEIELSLQKPKEKIDFDPLFYSSHEGSW